MILYFISIGDLFQTTEELASESTLLHYKITDDEHGLRRKASESSNQTFLDHIQYEYWEMTAH